MTEILLIVLIVLAIANIVVVLKKKVAFDVKPQMREVEDSILKFDTTLERTEKSIKDEFQTNRKENNDTSKMGSFINVKQGGKHNSYKRNQKKSSRHCKR